MQIINIKFLHTLIYSCLPWADPEGDRGVWTPLKNQENIAFLSNTGLDPLKNHKATKLGSSSVCQRNAISMAFRWRADDGQIKAEFGSSIPPSTKKKTKLSESFMSTDFSKLTFSKTSFRISNSLDPHQVFCWSRAIAGSKLFAKVICRGQKLPLNIAKEILDVLFVLNSLFKQQKSIETVSDTRKRFLYIQ